MVSYGKEDFRDWAEENGYNDDDVALIRKTAAKRAWLWLLIPMLISMIGWIPGQDSWILVGQFLFWMFFYPFFFYAWFTYKCMKQGTFDDVNTGILLKLFNFGHIVTYLLILPIVTNLIMKIFVRRGFGDGRRGLIKKGKIGNHE